ncbi:RNA polymerase sigma factor [Spirosoma rhododendri]|uniref:Sigma-70 family RNA polymerase sigma factor n=1 Tax=Spirosoma rhododendri TaxID=2728024 RepID=A0A7L5DKX1_9BACT|nr:sigma-70 family RNA polymerase sigma factor [Spirosoma rhododendri]QJD78151.1 sigma-70 family RNA polymerase sigma factor [Spirosoma rhododendri]
MADRPQRDALPDLVAGCLRNHRQSQELLYRQFYGFAMSVCMRYAPTRDSALEVLNDGFLKVFTRLDQYDSSQSFKSWLRRIMINTAIDQYRQETRHGQQSDIERAEQLAPSAEPDAYTQLAHEDLLTLVQQLSPAYRLVFNLYAIDGYAHDEIADKLGISVGSSKSNLARARENLRNLLKQHHPDEYARVTR